MDGEPNPSTGLSDPLKKSKAPTIYTDGTYLDNNRTWHAEDSLWKAQQITKLLQRNHIEPSTVCEVGCGAGDILQHLSQKFVDTRFVGYERSPQAMAICATKASASVSYRMKDIFDEAEMFDCLLCIDVFEHVEDYMGFISKLRPRARYKIFHIPLDISILSILHSSMLRARQSVGHLHYFTQETAQATLTDCGYRIIDGFFTAPFDDLPSTALKARMARLPRQALFSASPAFAAKVLGGCSYLVLAE